MSVQQIPAHHLIYGQLSDYLTGEELVDTDDERFRQQLARMMVEEKGYEKEEVEPRLFIETLFNHHFVRSTVDLTVSLEGKRFLILRYGPGSLVSRERSAVAAARVLDKEYQIPLAVVTNSRDAELLDCQDGKVLGQGMEAIPDRSQALAMFGDLQFRSPLTETKRQRELRILNAFDLQRCCI